MAIGVNNNIIIRTSEKGAKIIRLLFIDNMILHSLLYYLYTWIYAITSIIFRWLFKVLVK